MSLQTRLSSLITSIGSDIKALNSRTPAGTVTVLPGSPVDGQVVNFLADAATGVIWQLRWRAAGGTYKWEFVGGTPMKHKVDTDEAFTGGTTYVDGATVGPRLTLPLPGEYIYHGTVNMYISGQTAVVAMAWGLSFDLSAPVGPNLAAAIISNNVSDTMTKVGEFTVLNPLTDVRIRHNCPAGVGTSYRIRWRHLLVQPVRCGAA